MNKERFFLPLTSLSAVSLFGWTIFLAISSSEIRSAIASFLPFLGDMGNMLFFSGMIVFFVVSGLLISFGVFGDRLPKILFKLMLALIFLMAAIPKMLDPAGFALDISHYDIFPKFAVNMIAITVPWIEGVIALSLIFSVFDRGGTLMVNLLMIGFLILLGQAWIRGLDIDCGCFGHMGAREAVSKAFIRDLFFVFWAAALFIYLWKEDKKGSEAVPVT